MKFFFDFFPIIIFFGAYYSSGIYVATASAIAATFIQVAFNWFRHKRVEKMHLVTLVIISVFGGLTLWLRDPLFIKWKPTVVYWLFAITMAGSHFVGEKPLIQRMMGHAFTVTASIWLRLSLAWVLFFLSMGFINLYVAYNFDESTWVNFKMFGGMGLTFAFVLGQGLMLSKYIQVEEKPEGGS